MSQAALTLNEEILQHVESIGGGYVWDAEVFAINLFDASPTDTELAPLSQLNGVQQIALNASRASFNCLSQIAQIPQLQSLVLCGYSLTSSEMDQLSKYGPEVEYVDDLP